MTERTLDLEDTGYMIDDDYIDAISAMDFAPVDERGVKESEMFELSEEPLNDNAVQYAIALHEDPKDFDTDIIASAYVIIEDGDERTEYEIYESCFEAFCQGCEDWGAW